MSLGAALLLAYLALIAGLCTGFAIGGMLRKPSGPCVRCTRSIR